jgi:hypothetical protein
MSRPKAAIRCVDDGGVEESPVPIDLGYRTREEPHVVFHGCRCELASALTIKPLGRDGGVCG